MSKTSSRSWWEISVGDYGTFAFYGSEVKAEEMRAHKARWEQSCARMRPIGTDHELVKQELSRRSQQRASK